MKRNFKAETLNLAIADFNNAIRPFDVWGDVVFDCDEELDWWEEKYWNDSYNSYYVDENGSCSCPEWFNNGFASEADYLEWLEGFSSREEKMNFEKSKIEEIKKTEISFTGKVTKEFFERYVLMAVETDGWFGRHWESMYLFEVDFYISNLSSDEGLSDIDYCNKQEKPEIREFLNSCYDEWFHGNTGFDSLYNLIYSKFE